MPIPQTPFPLPTIVQQGSVAFPQQTVVPVSGGNCVIEAGPADAGGVNFVMTTMPQGQTFSSAGVSALLAQVNTYQSAAKDAAILAGGSALPAAGGVSRRGCNYAVLAADVPAQIAAIAAIAATPANIGSS